MGRDVGAMDQRRGVVDPLAFSFRKIDTECSCTYGGTSTRAGWRAGRARWHAEIARGARPARWQAEIARGAIELAPAAARAPPRCVCSPSMQGGVDREFFSDIPGAWKPI
eukprot:COSAG02_NODE_3311_length_6956_cov_3.255359_1_plen_109_part_10